MTAAAPRRALAVPCFGTDPAALVALGVQAEAAGFDGFFIWDHMLFANDGNGPDILDPWTVLAVLADRTERITLGPMVTPLSRRRPWTLARQCVSIDRLSNGRLVLGVGLGSPAAGDFAHFGERSDDRGRAELLDEGLQLLAQFFSGERFHHQGPYYQLAPMRFTPRPVRGSIPVWVGGVLPARRPLARAARWDGAVPIRFAAGRVVRPSVDDLAEVRAYLAQQRPLAGYDLVVWSELTEPDGRTELLADYAEAGATWFIETGRPGEDWYRLIADRIEQGP
ncbi:MAG TPA: LLM class flavin-dependent oxidoreductase [Jatrophihabitans sp.]|nr:LLM class flavin-dependent oxidoreductase [Jatrophihabitans sp.]